MNFPKVFLFLSFLLIASCDVGGMGLVVFDYEYKNCESLKGLDVSQLEVYNEYKGIKRLNKKNMCRGKVVNTYYLSKLTNTDQSAVVFNYKEKGTCRLFVGITSGYRKEHHFPCYKNKSKKCSKFIEKSKEIVKQHILKTKDIGSIKHLLALLP